MNPFGEEETMDSMKTVIIQLRHSPEAAECAFAAGPVGPAYPLTAIRGVELDETYQAVAIPKRVVRLASPA